jgi:WD40 repeat protein
VNSAAFSPDGRQIISGSWDQTIKLWDIATGRIIRTFEENTSHVYSVAFSPDGRQILSGSDGFVKLWDKATGNGIRTFYGDLRQVYSIAFSPDGRQILASSGNTIIWDVATGREIRKFTGTRATFSPDGRQILSASLDGIIRLWDTSTGREIRTFMGQPGLIVSLEFSHDGKHIVSNIRDFNINESIIKIWDVSTSREIITFTGYSSYVHSVMFSPDGTQILYGLGEGIIILSDISTGRIRRTFSGHAGQVLAAIFNTDGRYILSSSSDRTIKLWDTATSREIRTFSGETRSINSVVFSSDGKQILSGTGNTIKLWDATTGREIRTFFGHRGAVSSAVYSPDGRQILSASRDNTVKLWDLATGREIRTFSGHTEGVNSVAFSPDGRQIVSGSEDKTIKIWDIATGRENRTIHGGIYSAHTVAFDSSGRTIISKMYHLMAAGDGIIKLWDVATGRELRTITAHPGDSFNTMMSVALSADRQTIITGLTGRQEGIIKQWDLSTGREIMTFSGHSDSVTALAISPDNRRIVSFSSNNIVGGQYTGMGNTIKLWNTATGREIWSFSGLSCNIRSLAFSPDGRQIISGSSNGTTRFWDVVTGREIAQFISFIDGEWTVITPDGFYNASPNGDRHLNVRVGNNVYGIDQYRSTFFRPQIIEARLQGRPDPVQVATTIQQAGEPPMVVIRSPTNGTRVTTNHVELSVVIDSRQPLRNIQFLVNGRVLSGEAVRIISGTPRGFELETTGIRLTQNQNREEFNVILQLDPGNNRIEIIATNPHEGRDSVEVFSQQAAAQHVLPNLWILSIGVNRYDSPLLSNLNYAVNDAREIVNVFRAQERRVYRQVNSRLIADGTPILPTRENILDGFDWLKGASPNDVIILFIAGHGLLDQNGGFFFMPSDAAFNDNGSIRSARAISFREIQSVLDVPGQKILFIDACHSAGVSGMTRAVDNNRLVRDLESHGTVILASSRGDQQSQERSELRHGVFTYAIIQGLRGEAYPNNEVITLAGLQLYVSNKVRELTNNAQEPTFGSPGYTDFPVARTR